MAFVFFHNFGTFLPCSDTCFLEVNARVFVDNIFVAIGLLAAQNKN